MNCEASYLDECKERLACTCPNCRCKNTWCSYDYGCNKGNQIYIRGEEVCIVNSMSRFGWLVAILVMSCAAGIGVAGYIFYNNRLRSYMDSQYMSLGSQNNQHQPLRQHASEA